MTDVSTQPPAHPPAKTKGSGVTKKLGPLPIWGWALMIVLAYLLYRYLKNRNSSASATGSLSGAGGTAVNGAGSGGSNNVSTPTGSSQSVEDWINAAQNALENLGYSQSSVDQAFQDYLAGNTLTPQEAAIISSATNLVGAAPAGLGIPNTGSGGSTGTTTPPPSGGGGTGSAPPTQAVTSIAQDFLPFITTIRNTGDNAAPQGYLFYNPVTGATGATQSGAGVAQGSGSYYLVGDQAGVQPGPAATAAA